ncbi:hypothetical protein HCCG_01150 [Helicobacter cinaedi CCUG 18818 = ATCC BAA-847]|uniref:Uncharacterized protein n=1 Tax=Helicobacter cinaedi CCUG 18818 = ATCC BAA-847 TaxID=537971 RepID=A0ABN0BAY7_9HELI|nr:hypothetical protein HCCG_01150 [Helicobacter cinaedi CCUG 18818 = ATCC BAA-847]
MVVYRGGDALSVQVQSVLFSFGIAYAFKRSFYSLCVRIFGNLFRQKIPQTRKSILKFTKFC